MTQPSSGRWTGPIQYPVDLVRNLQQLIPDDKSDDGSAAGIDKLIWCTVTSAYPDPVQLVADGPNTDPLQGVPSLTVKVNLGDRVLVALANRRMYVIGIDQTDQSVDIDDTGWISSGINFSDTPDWTLTSYNCRRVGAKATLSMIITYNGSDIVVGSSGNILDVDGIITVPYDWVPSSEYGDGRAYGQLFTPGVNTFWARVHNSDGLVDVTHGTPGATLSAGPHYFNIEYFLS